MNSDVKVSVVIPVYRVEKYIHQCIDSVINQTLKNIEIIIVDDGSPDRCGEIIDKYSQNDPRITAIHKLNGGVSAARNDGLKKCKGEYIYIMDSDDYLEKDALEKMYNNAISNGADIVISDHYTFDEKNSEKENHFFCKDFYTKDSSVIDNIVCMVLFPTYSPYITKDNNGLGIAAPWTKLIKRDLIILNDIRFDSEVKGIFDDGLFALAIIKKANSVSYIRECLYHYRVLNSSLIHKYNPNRPSIDKIIFSKIEHFGNKNMSYGDFWKAYYARVVMFTSIELGTFISNKSNKISLSERVSLIKEISNSSPYKKSFKMVDLSKLPKRYKLLTLLIRLRLYRMIILIYKMK